MVAATDGAIAANKTPPEIVRYLKKQGSVIEQRFFKSEGTAQIVVSFCVDENLEGGANEGARNPANVHSEIALFKKGKDWMFASKGSIEQGSIQEFVHGTVWGESVTYASEDTLCCPSKKQEFVFSTQGGKFGALP